MMQRLSHILLFVATLLSLSSCRYIGTIDDDTSDCGTVYRITYHMHAVNNTGDQITAQLPEDANATLRQNLTNLFTPLLHPTTYPAQLLFQQTNDGSYLFSPQTFNGDEQTLSLTLCPTTYRHTAVTGTDRQGALLADSTNVSTEQVTTPAADTIPAQTNALLSGRKDLKIQGNNEEAIHVHLYPANAAVAVVAKEDQSVKDVKVYLTDLASSYTTNDSTYHFDKDALVRTTVSTEATSGQKIYHALVFPSRDSAPGTIDTDKPQADGAVWRIVVLAKIADGSTTRSVLYVQKPLKAGDVRVICVAVGSNGAVTVTTAGVGASVTLDWNKGGEYNPDI